MAAISNSIRSAIRLRLAVHHFGSLPCGFGLTTAQIGLLLTLTLAGDIVVSLCLTTRADRIGRRRMLVAGPF